MSARSATATRHTRPALDDAACWKALADPTRRRIVELLSGEELCVCHLVDELAAPQPLVSHHVRVLADAGLIEGERFRRWTYYRLVPQALEAVAATLAGVAGCAPRPGSERRPCC